MKITNFQFFQIKIVSLFAHRESGCEHCLSLANAKNKQHKKYELQY